MVCVFFVSKKSNFVYLFHLNSLYRRPFTSMPKLALKLISQYSNVEINYIGNNYMQVLLVIVT